MTFGRAGAAASEQRPGGWRYRDHTRGSLFASMFVLSAPLLAASLVGGVTFQLLDLKFITALGEDATTAVVVTNQSLRQVLFVLMMGETGVSFLVKPAGWWTYPIVFMDLVHFGQVSRLSALALTQLAVCAIPVLAGAALLLRRETEELQRLRAGILWTFHRDSAKMTAAKIPARTDQ